MLVSTVVLGWAGIILFLILIGSLKKLSSKNEYAFIHLLIAFINVMWLPLPYSLYRILDSEILLVGTIFGTVYLLMLIITMAFQTGHIAFIVKNNQQNEISAEQGNYMMATLSNPFEGMAGVLKSLWALFLAIGFWINNEELMAIIMAIFSILFIYYLFIVVDASLLKTVKFISSVKPNRYLINLEMISFFVILLSYVTLQI